jgi:hypothetical protein
MKKLLTVLSCTLILTCTVTAQSKVFKEIGSEMSSEPRAIMDGGSLVGYAVLTRLEKASADSFNYKLSLLDENLNDIGVVNFKEIGLSLQTAAFESDVLCLAYLKSSNIGKEFKKYKNYKSQLPKVKNSVVTQFLNLDGKIIKTNDIAADFQLNERISGYTDNYANNYIVAEKLEHPLQLENIPGKGFAFFYGDKKTRQLITYTAQGESFWKKSIADANSFVMHISDEDIYLITKNNTDMEGGYKIWGYGFSDSSTNIKHTLQDKQGNELKILNLLNDPVTHKLSILGNIINPKMSDQYDLGKYISKNPYLGIFSVTINGRKKTDVAEQFSYWSDGSNKPELSKKGYLSGAKGFFSLGQATKDYAGNEYFIGNVVTKKPKWGSIGFSVITLPLLTPPLLIALGGYSKVHIKDAVILKQDVTGKISLDNSFPVKKIKQNVRRVNLNAYRNTFYPMDNPVTKSNYFVVDDGKDIFIYNINQKKIVRTIPHKDGKTLTFIGPAKEGSIMFIEYNRIEQYTKLSIEAL